MHSGLGLIFLFVVTSTFFSALGWKGQVAENFNQWMASPLVFKSLESKDLNEDPVQNEIQYFSFSDKDVWMMNQTHHHEKNRRLTDKYNPDRVAIVLRKNSSSAEIRAEYYQLPSGPLIWSDDLVAQKIKPRVSCTMCHANGPRLIRPAESDQKKFSIADEIKLQYWNSLIKSYGLVADIRNPSETIVQKEAIQRSEKFKTLKVKTCLQCHNGINRALLTQEQGLTIHFLVKNNLMPPLEFEMTHHEKAQLKRFLSGNLN